MFLWPVLCPTEEAYSTLPALYLRGRFTAEKEGEKRGQRRGDERTPLPTPQKNKIQYKSPLVIMASKAAGLFKLNT